MYCEICDGSSTEKGHSDDSVMYNICCAGESTQEDLSGILKYISR